MPSLQVTKGYRTKTHAISSTAVAISAAGWSWTTGDLADAERAYVSVFSAGVVMTIDGTTPTAALGIPVGEGTTVEVTGNADVQAIQLIRASSDATVSVTLEKF